MDRPSRRLQEHLDSRVAVSSFSNFVRDNLDAVARLVMHDR